VAEDKQKVEDERASEVAADLAAEKQMADLQVVGAKVMNITLIHVLPARKR
jgi:hypothetical protein